jgi:hypothetical protein
MTSLGRLATFASEARGDGPIDVSDVASLVAKDDGLINLDAVDTYESGGDARAFGSPIDVIDAT